MALDYLYDEALDRLAEAREFAKDELSKASGTDGDSFAMSPDGYCELAERVSVLRRLLVILEPEEWCPPHSYGGQATRVPGDALFTCEICGDCFVGTWVAHGHGGVYGRPADAFDPCGRCEGTGYAATGVLCKVCHGSATKPPDVEKIRAIRDHKAQAIRDRKARARDRRGYYER